MIAIIDYGMGNIHSVQKAFDFLGAQARVVDNARGIEKADKLVLPGVGAFDDAMAALKKQDLLSGLKAQIKKGKVFLGICLGMQLLFESSQEAEGAGGLSILKGEVKKIPDKKGAIKVPHIGWNQIKIKNKASPLFRDVPDGVYLYFCHSYYPQPKDKQVTAATSDYGIDFTSAVWKDNVYGTQFHPEKSQKAGLKILDNFIRLC